MFRAIIQATQAELSAVSGVSLRGAGVEKIWRGFKFYVESVWEQASGGPKAAGGLAEVIIHQILRNANRRAGIGGKLCKI